MLKDILDFRKNSIYRRTYINGWKNQGKSLEIHKKVDFELSYSPFWGFSTKILLLELFLRLKIREFCLFTRCKLQVLTGDLLSSPFLFTFCFYMRKFLDVILSLLQPKMNSPLYHPKSGWAIAPLPPGSAGQIISGWFGIHRALKVLYEWARNSTQNEWNNSDR